MATNWIYGALSTWQFAKKHEGVYGTLGRAPLAETLMGLGKRRGKR